MRRLQLYTKKASEDLNLADPADSPLFITNADIAFLGGKSSPKRSPILSWAVAPTKKELSNHRRFWWAHGYKSDPKRTKGRIKAEAVSSPSPCLRRYLEHLGRKLPGPLRYNQEVESWATEINTSHYQVVVGGAPVLSCASPKEAVIVAKSLEHFGGLKTCVVKTNPF